MNNDAELNDVEAATLKHLLREMEQFKPGDPLPGWVNAAFVLWRIVRCRQGKQSIEQVRNTAAIFLK